MKRLWVVAYDIEDDHIRRWVHHRLKDHGKRVQYSVFECWLSDEMQEILWKELKKEVEKGDSVRWYPLCVYCRSQVEWMGRGTPSEDEEFYLL